MYTYVRTNLNKISDNIVLDATINYNHFVGITFPKDLHILKT